MTVPVAVYPAMLVGTIAGHFLGMGFDAVVFGAHVLWVPLACSVLLEAVIGARYGAARVGHPLTAGERWRLSLYYSLALAALSLPLAVWLAAAKASRVDASLVPVSMHDMTLWGSLAVGGLIVYTGARVALMALFSRGPRRSPSAA